MENAGVHLPVNTEVTLVQGLNCCVCFIWLVCTGCIGGCRERRN